MNKLKNLLIIRWLLKHRQAVGIAIIVITIGLLVWYLSLHPTIIDNVLHTSPWVLLSILVLYCGMIGINVLITYYTIKLCRKTLPIKNTLYLSVYSSVINFFGPLQSGPAVRGAYLKTKIGLRIRDYTYTMLFYYFAFAAINVSLLFLTTAPILTALGIIAGVALIIFGTRRFKFADRSRYVLAIYIVAALQVVLTAIIYLIELHATGTAASFGQSLVYAGSANLSLFVALTPGAIGVREAFLLFTQSLHGIAPAAIVSAGILDRAFYVVFLIAIFLIASIFHVRDAVLPKKSL